jgi:hypothetical protein
LVTGKANETTSSLVFPIGLLFLFTVADHDDTPERRAVAYLVREVPRWSPENRCFSCHNNGDAARALYRAAGLSYPVPREALADTAHWLARPGRWDQVGKGREVDHALARLQFAVALAEATAADPGKDRQALTQAADLLARGQAEDGSWRVETGGQAGSPVTWGTCLATALARRTLRTADPRRHRAAVAAAGRWLARVPVRSVLDAAATLIGLEGDQGPAALAQQGRCLALIRKGQSRDGGWGPYGSSPPEPFDTAVVLLALKKYPDAADRRAMLRRGRAFLTAAQNRDGSWTETTRPPGAESYAQRLSTTGWATLALLETRSERKASGGCQSPADSPRSGTYGVTRGFTPPARPPEAGCALGRFTINCP